MESPPGTLTTDLPAPMVQRLNHVLCLPLQIACQEQRVTGIDDIVDRLTKTVGDQGHWKISNGPLPEGLTPEQCWQAQAYFHPFVRRFLFDSQRTRWLQRSDVESLQISLPKTDSLAEQSVRLEVFRCQLALFQPDIAILLLEVGYNATDESKDQKPPLPLHVLQRLLDRLRRVYPPYFDRGKDGVPFGGHCPESATLCDANGQVIGAAGSYKPADYHESLRGTRDANWTPSWSAHWQSLLAPLLTNGAQDDGHRLRVRQFGDDRAAIMSYVAFNDPTLLNPGQWVRLCFADDHGNDPLPYSESFLSGFSRDYCYDRYWYTGIRNGEVIDSRDAPSRVLNCGYAFSYVGKAGDEFFTCGSSGALFTFRHLYVTMGVVAHFQRANLLAASHRLTNLVERGKKGPRLPHVDEVRRFYEQFVEFTQTYWFDELTPQDQGQQIFAQWQSHLRTQRLYDEVRQELKDLVEYAELRASGELNEKVGLFGLAAVLLAVISAIAGILGMNKPADWEMSGWIGISGWLEKISWPVSNLSTISIPLLLAVAGILLWISLKGRKK
ncbi:MAG TPA: hypothetical protein PLX65_05415 [Accumulibacter sp.]|nr:hypothetical protein [Accumulibacter sp.]HMW17074.1 hypothetical protein [Accumulibacter sp.]HNI72951.1 hypothetical protein [Accumulibacter sp.]